MPAARLAVVVAALLALFALTALSVAPAFDGAFTFDEQGGLADNRAVHPGARAVDALTYRYSPDQARPLFFLSLWLDARAHGLEPRGFRVTNLLLHLACGAVVFLLLRRVSEYGALAGTALFLMHPLQAESIIYIWGRSEVLATFFGLAALLALTPPGVDRAPTPTGPGRLRWIAAWLLLALALAAKEEAILLPLIAWLFWRCGLDRPWREATGRAALFGIPVLAVVILRPLFLGAVGRQVFARSLGDNLLAQAVVTLRMARLTLLPYGLSIDHVALVPPIAIGLGAAALVGLIVAAALLIAARAGSPFLRRAACGVLVFLAGWLLYWMVPLPDLMSERRAYLPLFGASILAAALVGALADRFAPRGRRFALIAALVPTLLLAFPLHALLRARAYLWSAPERLWEEAARQAPWRARPAINLGVIAAGRGDLIAARAHFERAVRNEPKNPEALYNRGKLKLDAGDLAGAEADLAASVAADPNVPRARINHAAALVRLGRLDDAESDLQAALAVDPGDPRALTNYAEMLRYRGRTDEALALYRKALAADPSYAHAAARLGVALENSGDPRGAIEAYREYLRRGAASETDAASVRAKIATLEATLAAPGSIR